MDDDDKDPRSGEAPRGGETDLASIRAELETTREEARRNQERWVRERADLDNLKKRVAREREEAVRFGNEALLRDLLPVVDNLERALEHAQSGGDGQPLIEGVALVLKGLRDVLERHGVTRVPAHGARFDPAHHEAVAHVESTEHEPHSVIAEHQPGYRLNERLLRPALVTVAKAPGGGGQGERPNLAKEKGRG